MDREELGKMKLEALRLLALERGVDEARGMGKAELIDRLLPQKSVSESIVERAKEVVAHAVEAVEKLVEPRAKLERHESPTAFKPDGGFGVPSSTVHPHVEAAAPAGEPIGMLDFEELPDSYGVDECEVLYKDPHWVFAYWEVTDGGLSAARAQLGQSAASSKLVMRLFTTLPGSDGVERQIDDVELPWNNGRRYLNAPKSGAHLRVAVGLLSHEGYFAPIAHSSLVRVPPAEPQPGPVEWMEVIPPRTRGQQREPLVIVRRGADRAERGVRAPDGVEKGGSSPTAGFPGSSPTKRGQ
jgi:uncharacterized protein DUF4912